MDHETWSHDLVNRSRAEQTPHRQPASRLDPDNGQLAQETTGNTDSEYKLALKDV
ncbi:MULTISPECIES: hypothetical protein [Nocardioides]|uniref:hypothetical protein n=1 Tax=Nocardioides TaxID=1839 RepID=UPI0004141647|nr:MULTISPECIES: hypothetical protein [Nocardioides]